MQVGLKNSLHCVTVLDKTLPFFWRGDGVEGLFSRAVHSCASEERVNVKCECECENGQPIYPCLALARLYSCVQAILLHSSSFSSLTKSSRSSLHTLKTKICQNTWVTLRLKLR